MEKLLLDGSACLQNYHFVLQKTNLLSVGANGTLRDDLFRMQAL